MFLKLLRTGVWFTTLPVAAELIFVGKKKERGHFVLFQPPLNYGKRDDKKKSLLFQRVLLGSFSPVCVCDPISFLMRARYWGVGSDIVGGSGEVGAEKTFCFVKKILLRCSGFIKLC